MVWQVRGSAGAGERVEEGLHFILHNYFLPYMIFSCHTDEHKLQLEKMEQETSKLELQIKTLQGEV